MVNTTENIMVIMVTKTEIALRAIESSLNLCHIICHRLRNSTKVL
jgi:hypothetical protein